LFHTSKQLDGGESRISMTTAASPTRIGLTRSTLNGCMHYASVDKLTDKIVPFDR
jgi:hypothetical protein